jgi:hypothetical protein
LAKVAGLQKAPEYNGAVGMVLTQPSADDTGTTRQQLRLFAHAGKVLQVREENVSQSRDDPDWVLSSQGRSVLEGICSLQLGEMDACDKFAEALWTEFVPLSPSQELALDHGTMVRRELMSVEGHKLFWLGMDAVCHHFILEKCNGSWRLFQSFVKDDAGGFTAREWCCGPSDSSSSAFLERSTAWKQWGGGRILSNAEVDGLLDVVVGWQKVTRQLLKCGLLSCVPGLNPKAAAWFSSDPRALSQEELIQAQGELQKVHTWSQHMIDQILMPCPVGIRHGADHVEVRVGTVDALRIPVKLYAKCDGLSRKLTGEAVLPAVFFYMLNVGIWVGTLRNPDNGDFVGFTYRSMALDRVATDQETQEQVARLRRRALEEVGALSGAQNQGGAGKGKVKENQGDKKTSIKATSKSKGGAKKKKKKK